jgi:DNA-binding NtrC family response regulator
MTEKIKILIVEDNKRDADLLQLHLIKSELNFVSEIVQTKEGFESALDIFSPDIIISDYSLPSFDGVSAFHIKQQKNPDTPFIILSGTIGEENAVELIKFGINDYALKTKLFTLIPKITRALKEAGEKKAKKAADEKLKNQNEKLVEIAFLQSHQVRAPIANIIGLIGMFNSENPNDPVNAEVISNLQTTVTALDSIILNIVQKTHEIKQ